MSNFTDLRLKVRHFVRKYKRIIFICIIIWLIIVFINQLLKLYKPEPTAETTYEPHTSVMSTGSSVPKKYQTPIEEKIKEYVGYCNNGDFDKAYNMLSSDCKKYAYPKFDDFVDHVLTVMPLPREYNIQNYSNMKDLYIYDVRYTENYLATGLTNSTFSYSDEKISFTKNKNDELEMGVGGFVRHDSIKASTENEYLKIEIIDRNVYYGTETYTVKFTNKTNYDIVICDYNENDEVLINLNNEYREADQMNNIILYSNASEEHKISFSKFVDDNDTTNTISFNGIRVLDSYYGVNAEESEIEEAVTNAIAKFSMQIYVNR